MKTLVLCVDRDDDFGRKAGLNSPFIGREENMIAANGLALKDPEDSDINTIFAAISMYDEMLKKGVDVEIATICGDIHVGYESDLALTTQLETVINTTSADRVILVSDGAEDEYIYPIISSRIKVDSVKKVYVKQAPTLEGIFYIVVKMIQDDKMRKRILAPIGLALLIYGLFSIMDPLVGMMNGSSVSYNKIGISMIWLVVGAYLVSFAYKLDEHLKLYLRGVKKAVRSGSQLIPFAVLSLILLITAIFYGWDSAAAIVDKNVGRHVLAFFGGFLWLAIFSYVVLLIGRFVNNYALERKITYGAIVESITIFAVGFIVQGALDSANSLFGYASYEDLLVVLEFVLGFGLAIFAGILNFSFRAMKKDDDFDDDLE